MQAGSSTEPWKVLNLSPWMGPSGYLSGMTRRVVIGRLLILLAGASALAGCMRGYKSADDLNSDKRGPDACVKSCQELGLQMSAFVLVEAGMSGCVCSPPAPPPPQYAPGPPAPVPAPPPAAPGTPGAPPPPAVSPGAAAAGPAAAAM